MNELAPALQDCTTVTFKSENQQIVKNKSSDNWYTPSHIVELVVLCLGEIDLDPCAEVGKKIPAREHYTIKEDGLSQQWCGCVFLNPPYSCPGKWIAKLTEEISAGRVTEAIALVPGATDTNWLSPVLKTQPVCFWKGRIKFLDTNYEPKLPARQSHVLIYWGHNSARFQEVFEQYGVFKPSTYFNTHNSNTDQVLGGNILHLNSPSTQVGHSTQTIEDDISLSISSNAQLSNKSRVLGGNILHSNSPSTPIEHDAQTLDDDILLSIPSNDQVSSDSQVLGGNILHSNSPSTLIEHDAQPLDDDISLSIPPNDQVSSDSQVLGGNILHLDSPGTQVEHDIQTLEDSLLISIPSDEQVSNESEVLGENILHSIPTTHHRKHGEGSGNLSWGYANANSKKKKPIKQLYFEWEYAGMRGKTYVRAHLKEQVTALNEAKAPVVEILELLTYNPKVARVLGK